MTNRDNRRSYRPRGRTGRKGDSFQPLGTTTRAQAGKVLATVLDKEARLPSTGRSSAGGGGP